MKLRHQVGERTPISADNAIQSPLGFNRIFDDGIDGHWHMVPCVKSGHHGLSATPLDAHAKREGIIFVEQTVIEVR
jgi:hypothetical protein